MAHICSYRSPLVFKEIHSHVYFIDIDEIPGSFLFLNFNIFILCSEELYDVLFSSFTFEDVDVVMVTNKGCDCLIFLSTSSKSNANFLTQKMSKHFLEK